MSITFYVQDWDKQETVEKKVFLTDLYPNSTEDLWVDDCKRGAYGIKFDEETQRHYEMIEEAINPFPELNMCNANASLIISALGLEYDSCGDIEHSQISKIIQNAISVLNSDQKAETFTRKKEVVMKLDKETATIEPRFISFGADADYVKDRLKDMMELLSFAQKNNKSVYWA